MLWHADSRAQVAMVMVSHEAVHLAPQLEGVVRAAIRATDVSAECDPTARPFERNASACQVSAIREIEEVVAVVAMQLLGVPRRLRRLRH